MQSGWAGFGETSEGYSSPLATDRLTGSLWFRRDRCSAIICSFKTLQLRLIFDQVRWSVQAAEGLEHCGPRLGPVLHGVQLLCNLQILCSVLGGHVARSDYLSETEICHQRQNPSRISLR